MLQNLVTMNLGAAPGGIAGVPTAGVGLPGGGIPGAGIPGAGIPGRSRRGPGDGWRRCCRCPGLMTGAWRPAACRSAESRRCPASRRSWRAAPLLRSPDRCAYCQGAELLSSLTRIQHGDVSVVAGGDLPLAATLVQPGTTNVLRELKSTSLASGMEQMDSMTLDIVAMLFDQIFGDEQHPDRDEGPDRAPADPDAQSRHPGQEFLLQEDRIRRASCWTSWARSRSA